MKKRVFEPVTPKEIQKRETMYRRAEYLGIDLLAFDADTKEIDEEQYKKDVRMASLLLGEEKEIPKELEERLLLVKNKKKSKRI